MKADDEKIVEKVLRKFILDSDIIKMRGFGSEEEKEEWIKECITVGGWYDEGDHKLFDLLVVEARKDCEEEIKMHKNAISALVEAIKINEEEHKDARKGFIEIEKVERIIDDRLSGLKSVQKDAIISSLCDSQVLKAVIFELEMLKSKLEGLKAEAGKGVVTVTENKQTAGQTGKSVKLGKGQSSSSTLPTPPESSKKVHFNDEIV